jgi:hypothetical protein
VSGSRPGRIERRPENQAAAQRINMTSEQRRVFDCYQNPSLDRMVWPVIQSASEPTKKATNRAASSG